MRRLALLVSNFVLALFVLLSWFGSFVHSDITGGNSEFPLCNFCDDLCFMPCGTALLSCSCPISCGFLSLWAIL